MPTAEEHGFDRKTGFLPVLKRTISEFQEDNLTDWAAALTYYAVLAMFPALIAMVSVVGLVFDPATVTRSLTDIVSQLGPSSAIDTFRGPIESVTANNRTAGLALIFGLLAALWAASGYIGAFMRASNVIFEVDEGRPFWKLRPLQMAVTLVAIILVALGALSVVLTGPVAETVGSAIGLGDTAVTLWNIVKWPVLVLIVGAILAFLYWSAPNARIKPFKKVLPGTLLAVVVWIIASAGFAFYVANFGSYDKTYGSLAGVVVFLVWLWISNVAVLLGAQLNAELERSRQIDAGTPGAERELRLAERDEPKDKKRPTTA